MSDHTVHIGEKVVRYTKHNYVVVTPLDSPAPVPLDCPVCGFLMRDQMDIISYNEFTCCDACSLKWAQPRRKDWCNGWRPSHQEIHEEVLIRGSKPSYLVKSV